MPLSTEGVVEMVRAGLGVTTMAAWAVVPYRRQGGLSCVPITRERIRRTWNAATRSGERRAYVDAFVNALLQMPLAEGIPASS